MALYKKNTVAEVVPAPYVFMNQFSLSEDMKQEEITNKLYQELTIDDNPIIFLFTIKDDIGKYVIEE